MKKLRIMLWLLPVICATNSIGQSIYSTTSDTTVITHYADPDGTEWPVDLQDSVFIFCSDISNSGSLTAPFSSCTYQWYRYNSNTMSFDIMNEQTAQTASALTTGGYRVVDICSGDTSCFNAWVFVNQTFLDGVFINEQGDTVDNELVGCDPFSIHGIADPINNMTVYNPPATDFVVGPNTVIEVCFSATHTWVSDLGFYLCAPGYGPGMTYPSVPGQTGTVELLPSVAAWDDSVTGLNSNILDCDVGAEIGTNCNGGDNVDQFCFTTELPFGTQGYVPCVCDLPTPLIGTYASAGTWSTIYGFHAGLGGWSVQIYDCIGADVGHLTEASITFIDQGQCGESVIQYNSGPINEAINDLSCGYETASIYTVPLAQSYNYTVNNTIVNDYWESDGSPLSNGAADITFNPPPTVSTTYCFHATDNFGCTRYKCLEFITLPTVATIIPVNDMCDDDAPVVLEAADGGGTWTCVNCNGAISNNIFYPESYYTVIGPPGNIINYSIGGPCPDTDYDTILVNQPPSVINVDDSCDENNNTQYFVEFNYSGGTAPYTFTHLLPPYTGSSAGTGTSGHFFSFPIQSGAYYNIQVDIGDGCGMVNIVGHLVCDCGTHAGTMNLAPITACEGTPITAIHNGNQILNSDDEFEFIIHNGTGPFPYQALAVSEDPIFSDSEFPVVYGQTYYISAIAGYNLGGHVDTTDTCYSQAMGTPVKWLKNPEAIIPLEDDEVCGKTIELYADSLEVGIGNWDCLTCNDYIPVNNTTYTDTDIWITVADDFGPQTFIWSVYNGNCTAHDSIIVNFLETPTAYAGPDKTVCGLFAYTQAEINLLGDNGEWSGNGTFVDDNATDSIVIVNDYGLYPFIWTEYNSTGPDACSDDDIVKITFIPEPHPDAGDNDTVCGTTYLLRVVDTLPSGIRYGIWSYHAYNPDVVVSIDDIYEPTTNVTLTGNFSDSTTVAFIWYERNNSSINPLCETRDTVRITFVAIPSSNAGIDDEICGNSIQLHADILGFTAGTWSVTVDITAVFDTAATPAENIGDPGSEQGTHDPDAWLTITSLGAFGDSARVVVPVAWIISNLNCKVSDTVDITFYQRPEANAGLDDSICGLTYQLMSDRYLEFSNSSLWSVVNGPTTVGITYIPNPPIDTNTIVNVPLTGTYCFLWTEMNPNMPMCKDKDTVCITFFAIPNPDAGDDFNVCGKTTLMDAIPSVGTTGCWQQTGPIFSDPCSPTSQATVNTYNSYIMRWCETNSICSDCDTVLVTFYQDLEAVQQVDTLFPDIILPCCENIFPYLDANNYYNYPDADGFWTDVIGGMQTYSPNSHTPACSVTVFSYGLHIFYWVLTNGTDYDGTPVCIDSSEAVKIHFYQRPNAFAGNDTTACELSALLHASATPSAHGQWSSPEPSAEFHFNGQTNDTLALDSVTVDVPSYDQSPDNFYEFYWQEDSGWEIPSFECSDIDTVRVIFAERPTALFHFNIPPCYGEFAKIWADSSDPAIADIDSALFEWTWGNDTDAVNYGGNNPNGNGPHLISWTPADTFHVVSLRVTNQFGCISFQYSDTVFEPNRLDPEIIITPATCGNANGSIILSTDANHYTFTWLDTMPGPNDTVQQSLFGGTISYYDLQITAKADDQFTYQGVYCTEVRPIYVPDTGEVTALFDTSQFVFSGGLAIYDSIIPAQINFFDLSSESARSWRWRFFDQDGNLVSFLDEDGELVTETTEQYPNITFMDPGVYTIQLYVTSREGCEDIYTYRTFYIIPGSSIDIPNIFTPGAKKSMNGHISMAMILQKINGMVK
ncbi:MAG: hypothetical protein HY738_04870 [Bacteroidia bacterium]|nr:hypothetical protein [Bacteroidia bacterium]